MEGYRTTDILGKGSFGKVSKAVRKSDGKVVAIKEIDYSHLEAKAKHLLVNEVNILKRIQNEHVVRYYDRFVDREAKVIYIVMEYCEWGDLQGLIRQTRAKRERIDEEAIWTCLADLCQALNDCHNGPEKIIHRDIKPGNIFVCSDGHVKLGDFGLARTLDDEYAMTCLGTPLYMSPELSTRKAYNEKSDIWALGCVIYEMAALTPPFHSNGSANQQALKRNIVYENYNPIPSQYSPELGMVIQMMLQKDPNNRPAVQDLMKIRKVDLAIRTEKALNERARIKRETERIREKISKLQSQKTVRFQ